MSKFTKAGIAAWIISAVLFIFQSISTFMTTEYAWKNYCLIDFMSDDQLDWIDGISIQLIQNAADLIITSPLMLLSFIAGVCFLISGAIFSK